FVFFFSSRRRHTRFSRDWSSDVCSSDLWEDASDEAVRNFLRRWEGSSLALLQQGQNALTNLILLACYSSPAAWPQCGYPGPPGRSEERRVGKECRARR